MERDNAGDDKEKEKRDSRDLPEESQSGNHRELIDMYAERYPSLMEIAFMIMKEDEAASDVMQNVAVSILKEQNRQRNIDNPYAFFKKCILNAAITYIRKESKANPTDPAIIMETRNDENSHAAMDYIELEMTLRKYLSDYSSELQDAFIKRYMAGYPLDAIAKEIGMTPNALSQRFLRMRNKLLAEMSKEHTLRQLS